ncbi:MAG: alpha-amylase [Actinobacteria bacterium]|nr:alpha-amylase [Actinomycetota bacterium]MBW3650596.1 alpha-amylase [Actinomycetota bacterium]
MPEPWWKSAVIYQIYPRSFCDTTGDGVGDLEGIRRHLDHLQWLGVDAIWLSPFFRSPMADFGYDVADYCDVDPLFGTLADFDRLVDDAHARGIRVLIDWVPNHTSDQHPWFVESRSSRDNPKAGWYWWRDGSPDVPPNNWIAAFTGGPAWTWDENRQQWYLHMFLAEQPDLNWWNPEVVEAMHATLCFWLDRGVDGFRMDVVHLVGKDPALPDLPPDARRTNVAHDYPGTHGFLRGIRKVLDGYPDDRMIVGEVYILDTARVATYYGAGDELHLAFNFPPLYAPWDAGAWREQVDQVVQAFDPVGAWPTWVLSNHDNPRHATRYGSQARARAAAVLLLGLRGTPFLYAGEELGLEDAHVPPEREVDPGGRDGCRAPVPWTREPDHGWGVEDPWLPWPPQAAERSVEAQREEPGSMLHLYRRMLAARRGSEALRLGSFSWLEAPPGVLAFERRPGPERPSGAVSGGDDHRVVLVNFLPVPVPVPPGLVDAFEVEVASDGSGEGRPFSGEIGPDQALVLRPVQGRISKEPLNLS